MSTDGHLQHWQLSSAIAYHCSFVEFLRARPAHLCVCHRTQQPLQRSTRGSFTREDTSKQTHQTCERAFLQLAFCRSYSSTLSSEQRRWRLASIFMQYPQGLAAPSDQHQISSCAAPAQQYLSDCSRVLVFNEAGQVLFSRSCQVSTDQCLQQLFSSDFCLKHCMTCRHHLLSFRAFKACLGQGKRPCTLVYCLITGVMK